MQHQGLRELLLPHRFSLWGRTAEQINALDLKDRPIVSLPFPLPNPLDNTTIDPVNIGVVLDGLPPQLTFLELEKLAVTTRNDSRTKITKAVQNYPISSRLNRIRSSDQLWAALVGFAVGRGEETDDEGTDDEETDDEDGNPIAQVQPGQFHTYRNGAPPVPPLEEQIRPIFNLWGWFLMHLATPTPLVNSELSVQDEIHRQILHPMNQVIQVMTTYQLHLYFLTEILQRPDMALSSQYLKMTLNVDSRQGGLDA